MIPGSTPSACPRLVSSFNLPLCTFPTPTSLPTQQSFNQLSYVTKQLHNKSLIPRSGAQPDSIEGAAIDAEDDRSIQEEEFEEEELMEEYVGYEVNTADTDWGETALTLVQRLIDSQSDLALYSFRAIPAVKRLDVRIDKLSDRYGSPSLDEVGEFAMRLSVEMEAALGVDAAGAIEIEVSSPGAERAVRVPEELQRFSDLPMRVKFAYEDGNGVQTNILEFVELGRKEELGDAEAMVRWKLADVRANRSGKGRGLNKKQRETIIEIPVSAIRNVNLHVDI